MSTPASLVTIGIPARNAASTIERALRSALTQGDSPILLIDDWSSDDTVAIARRVAGRRLQVVAPSEHRSLGFARQTGILNAATPYLVWLDADDELLPGRVERMVSCFVDQGVDIVSDGIELVDGATNTLRKLAPIPAFLRRPYPLTRLFERNYLPGSAMIGLRVAFARSIGYDGDQLGAEDSDFLLRCAVKKPSVSLLDDIGYRMYTYPASLSRNIGQQRAMVRRSLVKHRYDDVLALFADCSYPPRIAMWSAVSMAIFRAEYAQALQQVGAIAVDTPDPRVVLEPDGPNPYPEAWRLAFFTGTLRLLTGDAVAGAAALEEAEALRPSAEGANNLGVACARSGRPALARAAFEASLARFPDYLDARLNFTSSAPSRVTTHPIRTHAARDDYQASPLVTRPDAG